MPHHLYSRPTRTLGPGVRRPHRTTSAAVCALALVLAGCGGSNEEATGVAPVPAAAGTEAGAQAKIPDGYRSVQVPLDGFALAVPVKWKSLPIDSVALEEFIEANPDFGLDADNLPQANYLAYSPDGSGTNVNVLRTAADGSLDELQAGLGELLEQQLKATDVDLSRAQVAAGDALRTSYLLQIQKPGGGTVVVRTIQHIVVSGGTQYVLTVSLFGKAVSTKVADQIGRTLALI